MFFADPPAAFANLRRALRPGGRLVAIVWQPRVENEWASAVPQAIRDNTPRPHHDKDEARDESAFSLGDPDVTRELLRAAGFTEVGFTSVREPVYYGADVDAAYRNVVQLREPQALLRRVPPERVDAAKAAVRAMLAAHDTGDGVLFDAAAWIIRAM
jgi:SAM-dependent methyltransferase